MDNMSAIILLVLLVAWWWLWFRLFRKIQQPGIYALFMFFPLVNVAIIIWFIFFGWPNRPREGQRVGKML